MAETYSVMDADEAQEEAVTSKRSFFKRRGKSTPKPTIGADAGDEEKRRITLTQPHSFITEQFRTLRGRLDSLAFQRPLTTIAMTSPNVGDGKSTSSINLSIVSAMAVGKRVLLVDCDMRRPSIATVLGLEPKKGLGEILLRQATLDEAVMRFEDSALDVLCVASQPSNPSELLASQEMRSLMEEVTSRYDRVILDTPVAMGLPDTGIIAELSDGVLLVVRAGSTAQSDIEACLDLLDRRRVLGLVLNGAEIDAQSYGSD